MAAQDLIYLGELLLASCLGPVVNSVQNIPLKCGLLEADHSNHFVCLLV